MKKLICITSALILVFSSFAFAFADTPEVYTAHYGQGHPDSYDYYEYTNPEETVYFQLGFIDSFDMYSYEENGSMYAADYLWSKLSVGGGVGSHYSIHVAPDCMAYCYEDGEFSEELFEEGFEGNDFFTDCGHITYDPDTGLLEVFIDQYSEEFGEYIHTGKLYASDVDDPYYGDFIPLEVCFCVVEDEEPLELCLDPYVALCDPYLRDMAKICSSYQFEYGGDFDRVQYFEFTKPDTLEKPEVFSAFIESLGYDPLDLGESDPDPQGSAGLSGIIESISAVFTATITWVSTVVQTIMNEPLLLLFAVVPLIYLGVTMTRRLLNL